MAPVFLSDHSRAGHLLVQSGMCSGASARTSWPAHLRGVGRNRPGPSTVTAASAHGSGASPGPHQLLSQKQMFTAVCYLALLVVCYAPLWQWVSQYPFLLQTSLSLLLFAAFIKSSGSVLFGIFTNLRESLLLIKWFCDFLEKFQVPFCKLTQVSHELSPLALGMFPGNAA